MRATALVGRQHEFLDDLVALGILHQMRADHLAPLVEIDLHLRQRQLDRAPLPAAAPRKIIASSCI